MKILVISPTATHPTFAGNSACILSYTNLLRNQGHDVYFLWVNSVNSNDSEVIKMSSFWGSRLLIFSKKKAQNYKNTFFRNIRLKMLGCYKIDDLYPIGLSKYIKKEIEPQNFECVIVNYIFLSKSLTYFDNIKKILYTHDVFTSRLQKTGNNWFSTNAKEEAKALNRADTIWSIQEMESVFFRQITKKNVVTTYSHFPIVDTIYRGTKTLLFLAGSNMHNIEAINDFVQNEFRQIVNEFPNIKLIIGGSICDKIKFDEFTGNIELYGTVDNLLDFYSLGDIFINPTFSGTGLKIKTFEAMSYGKIIISNAHNTIGIYNIEKAPIYVVSDKCSYTEFLKLFFNDKSFSISIKKETTKYINELNFFVESQISESLTNE